MGRLSATFTLQVCVGAVALACAGSACVAADRPERKSGRHYASVYQRRAFEWMPQHGESHGRHYGRGPVWTPPRVSAGWFQRPYPYHLDYYRMRYGGSYAPYFGNLYGPPEVVTTPPYYGPYYGGYDQPNGYAMPPYAHEPLQVEGTPQAGPGQQAGQDSDQSAPPASP